MRWPRWPSWRRKKPRDHLMIVNLCGRGDKDIFSVAEHLGIFTMRFAPWLKALSLIVALPMLPDNSFAVEKVELSVGELERIDEFGSLAIAIRNNTDKTLELVRNRMRIFLER